MVSVLFYLAYLLYCLKPGRATPLAICVVSTVLVLKEEKDSKTRYDKSLYKYQLLLYFFQYNDSESRLD